MKSKKDEIFEQTEIQEESVTTTVAEVTEDEELSIEEATDRTISPTRMVLKRFFRSKLSMAGLIILLVLFLFSFLFPLFKFLPFVWGEQEQDDSNPVVETRVNPIEVEGEDGTIHTVYVVEYFYRTNYKAPSATHWLGTDDKGFDVFSRLMY